MNLHMQDQLHWFVTSTVSQTPFPLLRKASSLRFNAHSPSPHCHLGILNDFIFDFLVVYK